MTASRQCWWCGHKAEVDTSLPEDNGLLRDDSTFDSSESWICTDNNACNQRVRDRHDWPRETAP